MPSCRSNDGFALNTDISGIGVRISFYLQALFIGFLSARSGRIEEIIDPLYTLMATNTAMAITCLIVGLEPSPAISFQDAIIVLYLLSMSWIVVIASISACTRLSDSIRTRWLRRTSVIQGLVIFALYIAVLATADKFGSSPACNHEAIAVIFVKFSALHSGRIAGSVIVSIVIALYFAMTFKDYTSKVMKHLPKYDYSKIYRGRSFPISLKPLAATFHSTSEQDHHKKREGGPDEGIPTRRGTRYGEPTRNIDGELVFTLFFILIAWAFFVYNTEAIIRANQPGESTSWQFGQILPVMLTLLPLANMIQSFIEFGLRHNKMKKTIAVNANGYR